MEFTFDSWVKLMGSAEALSFVDSEDVREFQLRVPGVSQLDFHHLATLVMSGNAFKRLTDEPKRKELISRMKDIKYLIPSIYTLQKDFKYLRQCTDTLKRLLHGKSKPPFSAQILAYDAFSPQTPSGPDYLFYERMKRLYLFIMQDLVELTGEWPRLEDGEELPDRLVRLPGSWYRLANEAVRLGFQTDEITRLASENPDEQVALRALYDARPVSMFEYNSSELRNMVESIVGEFSRARNRSSDGHESGFTTTGVGEPIARRCGRQFSGAYQHDRWNFDLSRFSCKTPESMDITSLFVRKSVFHAFWRLEENEENTPGAESQDEPMPPAETQSISSENVSMYSLATAVSIEAYDQPISEQQSLDRSDQMRTHVERRHQTGQRPRRNPRSTRRRKGRRPTRRVLARLQPAMQSSVQARVRQRLADRHHSEPRQMIPVRISMTEELNAIPTPTMDLIRPLARNSMTVLEFIENDWTGGTWKEHKCHRESISDLIQDLKSHFQQGVEFYRHDIARTIAEHELPQYDKVCIAPRNVQFRDGHFPAEELL